MTSLIGVSPNWSEKLGLVVDTSQFVPERWADFVAPEDREETWDSLIEAFKSDTPVWSREFRVVDTEGKRVDVEINASILRASFDRRAVVIGAVLIAGAAAPKLVTGDLVRRL